jgi:hypothetical protein
LLLAGNKRVFLITICIYDKSNPLLEKREVALGSLNLSGNKEWKEKEREGRSDCVNEVGEKIYHVSGGQAITFFNI